METIVSDPDSFISAIRLCDAISIWKCNCGNLGNVSI